jgi:WD40 repeat protein
MACLPAQSIPAQNSRVPITPENAAQVTQLTRFGRGGVGGVAWSPDGQTLAVYGMAGIWLYDASNLVAPPQLLNGHEQEVTSVAYSRDGAVLVSGSQDASVRVWDAAGQEKLLTTVQGNFGQTRAAISPDGTVIAMSMSGDLYLRDAETGTELFAMPKAHSNGITEIAFSPDGRFVATSPSDKTAKLWNAADLALFADLQGHSSYVNSVAFSPDGRLLATGSSDKTMRLWRTQTGEAFATLELPGGNPILR